MADSEAEAIRQAVNAARRTEAVRLAAAAKLASLPLPRRPAPERTEEAARG